LATQLDVREKLHSVRLGENVTVFNPNTLERLQGVASFLMSKGQDAMLASQGALEALARTTRREAYVMAYADCFGMLAVLLIAMVVFVWFCRPAKGGAPGH